MFFDKFTIAFLAIGVASVNAFTGTAFLQGQDNFEICPNTCPRTSLGFVGVAPDKIAEGRARCCAVVSIAYEGKNVFGMILGTCPSCARSDNITLSANLFQQVGVDPTSVKEISPVVWNVL
ncbi:hypothetical protein E1B28_011590 [Marasmius oreades]|uniref:Uncharacterized protein n=1 Tax=Marasmius oreades TaxID=181124 RepID=A0A9P7RV60_9AGAR|nr:uncharacterized protein E1B28_011590 [Marasmius oreades]KAG7089965.1 hypothetical protein E1B28_011590 [Marasmius oreades]